MTPAKKRLAPGARSTPATPSSCAPRSSPKRPSSPAPRGGCGEPREPRLDAQRPGRPPPGEGRTEAPRGTGTAEALSPGAPRVRVQTGDGSDRLGTPGAAHRAARGALMDGGRLVALLLAAAVTVTC